MCWGSGAVGQFGYGDGINLDVQTNEIATSCPTVVLGTSLTAVAIACGDEHTCALLDDGSVKCWGSGAVGQLGYGDGISRGDEPNEMGDNLPTVDLGTNRTAVAIACGDRHTCALLDDGSVKCWGSGAVGQLGY